MSFAVKLFAAGEMPDFVRLRELYLQAGWIEPDDACQWMSVMVKNSTFYAGAFDGVKLIGSGRVISDGVSDGFIQDIVVDPAYRKRGVGGEIVKLLVNAMRARGLDWIGLVGQPGTRKFYEELGFRELEGHIPMRHMEKE